jgi:hypothetical protein
MMSLSNNGKAKGGRFLGFADTFGEKETNTMPSPPIIPPFHHDNATKLARS